MFQVALLLRETQKCVPKTEKKRLKVEYGMLLKLQYKKNFKKPETAGYEEVVYRNRETEKEGVRFLTPVSARKMCLAKVLLSRLKMAVPSVFPTAPSVFTVSINEQTPLIIKDRNLDQKRAI